MASPAAYRERRQNGLCGHCGLVETGAEASCKKCRAANNERRKKQYEAKKAASKCPQCGSPTDGTVLCAGCRGNQTGSQRRYYRNKAAGVCRFCGKPSDGKSRCVECAEKQKPAARRHYEKRKQEGRCSRCGRPVDDKTRCSACSELDSEAGRLRYRQLRDEVFAAYGGYQCSLCPCCDPDVMEIDHVDGGGNEHRREIGQSALYAWLKSNGFPAGFRVLCPTCNKKEAKRLVAK